jgi:hypothetical protein
MKILLIDSVKKSQKSGVSLFWLFWLFYSLVGSSPNVVRTYRGMNEERLLSKSCIALITVLEIFHLAFIDSLSGY